MTKDDSECLWLTVGAVGLYSALAGGFIAMAWFCQTRVTSLIAAAACIAFVVVCVRFVRSLVKDNVA